MYQSCPLYAIQSKKMLFDILKIQNKKWTKNEFVQQNISPYIDGTVKQRLVEVPSSELKTIQKRIKNCLSKCQFPHYIFSGVKGKSYVDNAKFHSGVKYLYKIDISAFFQTHHEKKSISFIETNSRHLPMLPRY